MHSSAPGACEDPWALPTPATLRATSSHPLLLGASPGTTGTMSLYFALKLLGISAVHYTRQFNASTGAELTTYTSQPPGGPVPLLRPLFGDVPATGGPPPIDLPAARTTDLRFLDATDALLDTPTVDLFFELVATFPDARVILTIRDPMQWAASRQRRHAADATPLFGQLGFSVPIGAISAEQAAAAFALWQKAVVGSVRPERLLVLDLFTTSSDELWRQLCAFVRRPLPVGKDGSLPAFPHLRYGDDMRVPASGPS